MASFRWFGLPIVLWHLGLPKWTNPLPRIAFHRSYENHTAHHTAGYYVVRPYASKEGKGIRVIRIDAELLNERSLVHHSGSGPVG